MKKSALAFALLTAVAISPISATSLLANPPSLNTSAAAGSVAATPTPTPPTSPTASATPTPNVKQSPASPLANPTPNITPTPSPSPAATPSPKSTPIDSSAPESDIRIMFIPPSDISGTFSLGIYNASGKLVHTLKREADLSGFIKDDDGLVTHWDGKNDSGKIVPAGKYSAHGFLVGDIQLDGVDTLGNDWYVDDNSPRIRLITGIDANSDSKLLVFGRSVAPGSVQTADTRWNLAGKMISFEVEPNGDISADKANLSGRPVRDTVPSIKGVKVLAETNSVMSAWQIVQIEATKAIEVREYTKGKLLRQLAIKPDALQPAKIACSLDGNTIYLLEENAKEQRVRCLMLDKSKDQAASASPNTAQAVAKEDAKKGVKISTWKTVFNKTITFSDKFDEVKSLLKFPDKTAFVPVSKLTVKLRKNSLLDDKRQSLAITAGFDAKGSFLKTTGGLELARISNTPNLKWVRIGRQPGSKTITVFQSDGAVIEEYAIQQPENMLSFDAGGFDFKPKTAAPKTAPASSPKATPSTKPTS